MVRRPSSIAAIMRVVVAFVLLALAAPMADVRAATGEHILLGVPATEQAWALSCEYAAASAATAYYGTAITQWRLRVSVGTDENPHKGFRGSITGTWGGTKDYGVYAEPIATVLRERGFAHSYVFYGGADNLRAEIGAGHPVVAWITGTWQPSSRSVLYDAAGDRYSLIPNEHAVTVYGYDDAGVWVMDPAHADKSHVSWQTFLTAWNQIDGMALVVAV